MQPGIYENLPFEEYLAIDALSNTRMGALVKSPKHYKEARPLEKAKHLVLGSLVHSGRLEALSLARLYAVCPNYHLDSANQTSTGRPTDSKVTTYVKEKTKQFTEANQDKQIVPLEWYQEMEAIVSSLAADFDANQLFNAAGPVELTLVWNDPDTGILCKARLDKCCQDDGAFADLKTTMDLAKFPKSLANYGYHRQMAHYQAGYAVLTGELLQPWIVAVEKTPPYCVQSAPLCEEALEAGAAMRRELIDLLAACLEHDFWPGPPAPSKWRVPEWALSSNRVELSVGGQKVSV